MNGAKHKTRPRTALVMGGGAIGTGMGIGKASAIRLARSGMSVFVADVDPASAAACCEVIRSEGGIAEARVCDVSDAADVFMTVAACVERFGGLDVLVNNVGYSRAGAGLFAHDEEVWDRVFAINMRGIFSSVRHAAPIMIEGGFGRIINISSIAAMRTIGSIAPHAYAASKAAVIQFTKTVAVELASKGITSNCVIPGLIDTPHASSAIHAGRAQDEAERFIAARAALSPTGAQGSPWDVAHAVGYLASDEAAYVNGVEMIVDAGLVWAIPRTA